MSGCAGPCWPVTMSLWLTPLYFTSLHPQYTPLVYQMLRVLCYFIYVMSYMLCHVMLETITCLSVPMDQSLISDLWWKTHLINRSSDTEFWVIQPCSSGPRNQRLVQTRSLLPLISCWDAARAAVPHLVWTQFTYLTVWEVLCRILAIHQASSRGWSAGVIWNRTVWIHLVHARQVLSH